jgi:hypothetical protein
MRHSFLILLSFISLATFGQPDMSGRDSGFTDKKDAKQLKISEKVFNAAKSKLIQLYPKVGKLDLGWDINYGDPNDVPVGGFMGQFYDSISYSDNYLVFDSAGNFIKELIQTDSTRNLPDSIQWYVKKHFKKYIISTVVYYLDSLCRTSSVIIHIQKRDNRYERYSLSFYSNGKFKRKDIELFPMGGFL